jgi:hypothetical protein
MNQIVTLRHEPLEGEQYMDLLDDMLKGATNSRRIVGARDILVSGSASLRHSSSCCTWKVTVDRGTMNGW